MNVRNVTPPLHVQRAMKDRAKHYHMGTDTLLRLLLEAWAEGFSAGIQEKK